MEKDISCKGKEKKAWVAYLYLTNSKAMVIDKEGHYIMIKGTIQQDDITLVNIYTPNIEVPKYVKQLLMDIKGEINRNTVIVGYFNTPLILMDRFSRQKINKKTTALNNTRDQMV